MLNGMLHYCGSGYNNLTGPLPGIYLEKHLHGSKGGRAKGADSIIVGSSKTLQANLTTQQQGNRFISCDSPLQWNTKQQKRTGQICVL